MACIIRSMVYTLKTLSRRIAFDNSDEATATAARRIEHWASTGLFDIAGVDIGPKALGRGRVRKYPEEALLWCLLWASLADRDLGLTVMATTAQGIRLKLLDKGQQGKWLRQAMRGEGPALFLFDGSAGLLEHSVGHGVVRQFNWKLARSPVRLADSWSGGFFLNLTEVYARAANE